MKRWLKAQKRRRVVVHTIDGPTIEGVLDSDHGDGVTLLVAAIGADELPGITFVPRDRVAFVQLPPAEALR